MRDRTVEEAGRRAGVPAGSREAGHRPRAQYRRGGTARPRGRRPPVRTDHRRSAAARAPCGPRRRDARTVNMSMKVVEATEAMVVVMEERASEEQIEQVVARLVEMGMDV